MILVRACIFPKLLPPPSQKKMHRVQLKKAIHQAMLICPNFEDTIECRLAWDLVDDLSKARFLRDNEIKNDDEFCHDDDLACREYDI